MHPKVFFGLAHEATAYDAYVILHQFLVWVVYMPDLEAVVNLSDVLDLIL